MMKKLSLILSLFFLASITTACGGSSNALLDTTWGWTTLVETMPMAQSVVSDPKNYTLVFNQDGAFNAKADCNQVSGSYEIDNDLLFLMPGTSTIAECGPDSLSDLFLANLIMINSYAIEDGVLILKLGDGLGEMQFQDVSPP
jgi:heat shock protein HslJ